MPAAHVGRFNITRLGRQDHLARGEGGESLSLYNPGRRIASAVDTEVWNNGSYGKHSMVPGCIMIYCAPCKPAFPEQPSAPRGRDWFEASASSGDEHGFGRASTGADRGRECRLGGGVAVIQ